MPVQVTRQEWYGEACVTCGGSDVFYTRWFKTFTHHKVTVRKPIAVQRVCLECRATANVHLMEYCEMFDLEDK